MVVSRTGKVVGLVAIAAAALCLPKLYEAFARPGSADHAGLMSVSDVSAETVAEQAREADSFVDSVGVATHLGYNDSPYYTRWPAVLTRLRALGVHHIRDGFYNWPSSSPFIAEHQSLAAAGIKCTYVIPWDTTTTSAIIQAFATRAHDLEAVEGPNECDAGANCGGGGEKGVRNAVSFMPVISAAGRALHVPIIGPSFTIASSYVSSGNLSAQITHNNLHVYFGGRHPGSSGWGDSDPEGHAYGSLAWWIDQANKNAPNLPVVITETGYIVNAVPTPYTVPGEVAASYAPRVLLLAFNQGVKRTFLYELLDEGTSDNYGLLRSDLSEKPAYASVKNLLSALSDPGEPFAPGKLAYTLANGGPTLRHTLLQKRNGSFWLVVWLEESTHDVATNRETPAAAQTVSLQLKAGSKAKRILTFDPKGAVSSADVPGTGEIIPLKVTDRVSIVEIAPR